MAASLIQPASPSSSSTMAFGSSASSLLTRSFHYLSLQSLAFSESRARIFAPNNAVITYVSECMYFLLVHLTFIHEQ
ncbi:hypothetical protein L6164_019730 [Bauhinia variegata]|uniref:Uncharacterized protein n=1 Tax=Bauhinia variegata TaxID=167791 RepID=A0ACB9MT67_BAUVA|nr:hypothetical protein L6164_019730 [Bauhinia variegata]